MAAIRSLQATKLIDEIDLSPFDNIIGFDLGHGQFALNRASDNRDDAPKTIEIANKKVQITAVAITHKNEVLIGDSAITGDYEEIKEVWIGFKRRPNGDSEFDRKMQLLMSEVIRKSKENGKIVIDKNTLILVGCPSEWEPRDQRAYQTVLEETFERFSGEKPTLLVIPESRAAVQTAKVSDCFTIFELQRSMVILIDFGSSTIDITQLKSGKDIHDEDDGCDLGAFLIDQLLLCEIIHRLDEDDRNIVLEALKSNHCNIGSCLVKAREVKESYFNQEKTAFKEKRTITRGPVILELQDGDEFELDIKMSMGDFRNLINSTPLSRIKESIIKWDLKKELFFFPSERYQKYSYYEAVNAFLQDAKDIINSKHQMNAFSKILITGGAARMGLAQEITNSVFSNSNVLYMEDPELVVASGLTLRGRAEILSARFVKDIHNEIFPNIKGMIDSNISSLYPLINENIVQHMDVMVQEAIKIACEEEQQKDFLVKVCSEVTKKWIKDKKLEEWIKSATIQWFNSNLYNEISDSLNVLTKEHSVPKIHLDRKTADIMAHSIDTEPIVKVLTSLFEGSVVSNAVENSMDWVDKLYRFFGAFDMSKLLQEQRAKLQFEIIFKIKYGIEKEFKNDSILLSEFEKTLVNSIENELKIIIAQETCAYL